MILAFTKKFRYL